MTVFESRVRANYLNGRRRAERIEAVLQLGVALFLSLSLWSAAFALDRVNMAEAERIAALKVDPAEPPAGIVCHFCHVGGGNVGDL